MLQRLKRAYRRRTTCARDGHVVVCSLSRVGGTQLTTHAHLCVNCAQVFLNETELAPDPWTTTLAATTVVGRYKH